MKRATESSRSAAGIIRVALAELAKALGHEHSQFVHREGKQDEQTD
jgi:hypothetical protein